MKQRCQKKEMDARQADNSGGVKKTQPASKPVDGIAPDQNSTEQDRNNKPVHSLFRCQQKTANGRSAKPERNSQTCRAFAAREGVRTPERPFDHNVFGTPERSGLSTAC